MKQIFIIVTDHNFQKGYGCYKESAAELKKYINEICDRIDVKAIGEEMSKDALAEEGVDKSICEILANELGIKYCMCDPDKATRGARGIRQENDIKLEAQIKKWSNETFKMKVSEENRKREKIWLEHILSLRNYPILFVCGANHVNSFRSLLDSNGLRSEVLSNDWLPNQHVYSDAR